jgi:RNA polymerase sigma factor (sigma-70 family)
MNAEDVIKENLPLVKSIAAKYANLGVPLDDLIQEGMIGLYQALQKYDASKGAKFSTYATYWVKKKILGALDAETRTSMQSGELNEEMVSDTPQQQSTSTSIQLPASMPAKERTVLTLLYTQECTLREIAQQMGLPRERVRQLKEKALRRLRAQKNGA